MLQHKGRAWSGFMAFSKTDSKCSAEVSVGAPVQRREKSRVLPASSNSGMSGWSLLVGRKSTLGMTFCAATGAFAGIGSGGYACQHAAHLGLSVRFAIASGSMVTSSPFAWANPMLATAQQ